MTNDYAGEPGTQEHKAFLEHAQKARKAGVALEEKPLETPVEVLAHRSFIAAQQFANSRFLINVPKDPKDPKPGDTIVQKMPVGGGNPSAGITPLSHREGDKFAEFVNGVLTTADPDIISWCDENPKICRPASDPRTIAWVKIKEAQTPLANRESIMDGDYDPDALFESMGVVSKGRAGDIVSGAQAAAVKADEDAQKVNDPSVGHN